MKIMIKLFILALICGFNLCFAFEGAGPLELNLKIRSSLYKTHIQTQLFVGQKVKSIMLKAVDETKSIDGTIDSEIDELLKEVLNSNSYAKERGVGPFLKGAVQGVVVEVREMARKEGIALAVWLGVGEVLELLSPVFATAIGMPQLIVPLELILAPEFNVPAILAVKKLIKRKKLVGLYGGKANFKYIKSIKKELKKKYGLGESSLMFQDEEGFYFSVSSSENIGVKLISALGLSKTINPMSLKRFFKKNDLWNAELKKIKKADLEPVLKSVLMISYVLKNVPDSHDLLLKAFPKSHFEMEEFAEGSEVVKWGLSFAKIETQEELIEWAKLAPSTATSLEVVGLWKDVFYPSIMEESKGMGFGTYRKLAKRIDALVAKAEVNPFERWDERWEGLFETYLMAE